MKIDSIRVDPVCLGPLKYYIRWRCETCDQENTLLRLATLLPPEVTQCEGCGTRAEYVYQAPNLERDQTLLDTINRLERSYFEVLEKDQDGPLTQPGYNLRFGVFAYFRNRLQQDTPRS